MKTSPDKTYYNPEELEAWNQLLWIIQENLIKCPWSKIQTLDSLKLIIEEEGKELKEAIELARKACKQIYEVQKQTLKDSLKEEK